MNINEVTIAGNITKDLELKNTPSGVKVLQVTLATNRTWKDQNGQKQEEVQYVDFVAFGKTAETIAQYCVKGQNMWFRGRYTTRSWEDKDTGQKRYKTEVVLENFQFGQKPQGNKSGGYAQKSDEIEDDFPQDDWSKDFKKPAPEEGGALTAEDIPF